MRSGRSRRQCGDDPVSMAKDERGYLIVPREVATGADCEGCLIVQERGDLADIVCNECGTVIDSVPLERAGATLMELACREICSARCPRCESAEHIPRIRSHRGIHLFGVWRRG